MQNRNADGEIFRSLVLYLEGSPSITFSVSEYIMYSCSEFYQRLVQFQPAAQPSEGDKTTQGDAQVQEPRRVCIPSTVTKDVRAVECFTFFLYTNLVFDVQGKDIPLNMPRSTLCNPVFSFDLVELFLLADYFEVSELISLMTENFFGVKAMFPHGAASHLQSERVLARILDKCEGLRRRALLSPFACTYAEGTGGLQCLCRSPLMYPRSSWDVLMKSASKFDILWMAHVLPLYVVRFSLTKREAMGLLDQLDLLSWVDGERKSLSLAELVRDINPAHLSDAKLPGAASITSGVPMQLLVLPSSFSQPLFLCACVCVRVCVCGCWC
jgi:hypothetical protein